MGFLSEESIAFFNEFYGNKMSEKPMEQTAVEWLEQEINRRGPKENNPPQWLHELYQQAKQMEREQIEKAYIQLLFSDCQTFEQYYTQTYGTRLQNETN